MPIAQQTVFVTDDGRQHETHAAAARHEAMQALARRLQEDLGPMYEGPGFEEIANWILDRYELRPDRETP